MRAEGIVVRDEKGNLMASVDRPKACEKCRGCALANQKQILVEVKEGAFREGDTVQITMPEARFLSASFLAYGIPLVLMILGIFAGGALARSAGGNADLWQLGGALLALALGAFLGKRLDGKWRRTGRFDTDIQLCQSSRSGYKG